MPCYLVRHFHFLHFQRPRQDNTYFDMHEQLVERWHVHLTIIFHYCFFELKLVTGLYF